MTLKTIGLTAFITLSFAAAAFGFGADAPLPNPEDEARARALFGDIRCLVCQNQSIEDSGADLAVDLRAIVREQISAGASDSEVLQFMVDRYGDWVLLEPKVNSMTVALWALPGVIGGIALLAAFLVWRHRNLDDVSHQVDSVPISIEDSQRLSQLLGTQKDKE